ncbi:unnamed protein product, partial [Effrenium voratum]
DLFTSPPKKAELVSLILLAMASPDLRGQVTLLDFLCSLVFGAMSLAAARSVGIISGSYACSKNGGYCLAGVEEDATELGWLVLGAVACRVIVWEVSVAGDCSLGLHMLW